MGCRWLNSVWLMLVLGEGEGEGGMRFLLLVLLLLLGLGLGLGLIRQWEMKHDYDIISIFISPAIVIDIHFPFPSSYFLSTYERNPLLPVFLALRSPTPLSPYFALLCIGYGITLLRVILDIFFIPTLLILICFGASESLG